MKTIMIIGAGRPQVPLIEASKKEGYHTIVCDSDSNAPGVPLADEYFNVSTKDRSGLLKTAVKNKIDGIVANSEYAMEDIAFISNELRIPGNPEGAISILSSKSKFRELQKNEGLFAPRVIPYVTGQWNEEISFPIVIKPDMNSGTRGTMVVWEETDVIENAVRECSKLSKNGKVIVEEYIPISPQTVVEGEVFIHEGEILWDGLFLSIRSKLAPMIPMTYVFPLYGINIDALRDDLTKAFRAIGVRHGEYNVEACIVDNKPFVIEINPRQGGNDLPKYIRAHCGIDYYKLLVTTSVNDDCYWNSLKGYLRENRFITHHMLFPRRSGKYKGLVINDGLKDWVYQIQINVDIGDKIEKTRDGLSSIGFVDLMFHDQEKQADVSSRLEELIRIEIDED